MLIDADQQQQQRDDLFQSIGALRSLYIPTCVKGIRERVEEVRQTSVWDGFDLVRHGRHSTATDFPLSLEFSGDGSIE